MMPYYWFLALERADSETPFLDDKLARFGYLPPYLGGDGKSRNPDGLPVGFVRDDDEERGPWVGLTCGACHTNQMTFAGKLLQIDGGPAGANFFELLKELGAALEQTAASDEKFNRFAEKVRKLTPVPAGEGERADDLRKLRQDVQSKLAILKRLERAGASDDAKLRDDLNRFAKEFSSFVTNSRTDVVWGPARLDAFGEIFNRATAIDLNIPGNNHAPNAPVSYPFLWDTSHHNVVQWNGSAPNVLAVERLARNVGEVLGVFGYTEIKKADFGPTLFYKTSVDRLNLLQIEQRLRKLTSPPWPRDLAPIDAKKAAAGKELYGKFCLGCHQIAKRGDDRFQNVTMVSLDKIGTDPMMATNALSLKSNSGPIAGIRMPPGIGDSLPSDAQSFAVVGNVVIGAILAPPDWLSLPDSLDEKNRNLMRGLATKRAAKRDVVGDLNVVVANEINLKQLADKRNEALKLQYKSRPLDGIWATAPYLHNGSVPNLYQLLLPSSQRDPKFTVGNREIDTKNVGFRSAPGDAPFEFDTSLPGNSSKGHEGTTYGTEAGQMTDDQRWQLVEYLKTL